MNRADRRRWRQADTLANLGEMVVAWLNGQIRETPGHMGPPEQETIPLIPALTLANRAGFVTENSQRADSRDGQTWNAWVEGFASDDVTRRLREMTGNGPLRMVACRGSAHEYEEGSLFRHLRDCPLREVLGFWSEACPGAADDLGRAWYVLIEDPEPGRNERLWPALEAFAGSAVAS